MDVTNTHSVTKTEMSVFGGQALDAERRRFPFLADKVLIHFNCISLASNFIMLKESITALEFKVDVIALSESWLSDNDNYMFCI